MARFQKGDPKPPNSGRKKGSQNARSVLTAAAAKAGAGDEILKVLIDLALKGDPVALRIYIDRADPAPKAVTRIEVAITEIETADDVAEASRRIIGEMAKGEISIDDAERVLALIRGHLPTIEATDWEKRLADLEQAQGGKHG